MSRTTADFPCKGALRNAMKATATSPALSLKHNCLCPPVPLALVMVTCGEGDNVDND